LIWGSCFLVREGIDIEAIVFIKRKSQGCVMMNEDDAKNDHLMGYYGFPEEETTHEAWDFLISLKHS